MTAPATTRSYSLGAVLPHVRWAAEQVGTRFGVGTILGWRASARDMGGHPAGLALDFMCSPDQGDQIAAHLLGNAEGYGLKYLIWRQRYREPGGEWEPMEDRGSPTQNHYDHVHAQFTVRPGTRQVGAGGLIDGDTSLSGRLANGAGALADAVNPFTNWSGDLLGVAVKAGATVGALALLVVGVAKTVTPGGTAQ